MLGAQSETEMRPEGLILPRNSSDTFHLGMLRYDTSAQMFAGYNGRKWVALDSEQKEREIVISASSLVPSSGTSQHQHTVGFSYFSSSSDEPSFFTSFNLPDSAEILRLSAIMYDKIVTKELVVNLYKDETTHHSNEVSRIGYVRSTYSFSDYVRYLDTDIFDDTAGSGQSYIVRVHAIDAGDGFLTDWPDDDLRIAKIIVVYQMP